MSKAASTSALEALHNKLAETLSEMIDEVDGETKGAAAILNVARQFLKDNHVEARAAEGSPLGRLAEKLDEHPFDPNESLSPH